MKILSSSFQEIEVSFQLDKKIKFTIILIFLTFSRISIRYAFHSVPNIHGPKFRERRSLLDYHKNYFQYIYIPISPTIGDINLTKFKSHDKKPRDLRNFYSWSPILWMDGGILVIVRSFFSRRISIYSKYLSIFFSLCRLKSISYSF